jgi:single-stranded-DNA-specific exonuclease
LRYGGHAAAAGCHMPAGRYDEFWRRIIERAGSLAPVEPSLTVDVVLDPLEVDYRLLHELAHLEPVGTGNPQPLVGIRTISVARVRQANGGHTQLVLRKGVEVLDGICFGRDDLVGTLSDGDLVDVVARLDSRTFGGFESLQLEIRDLAPAGTLDRLAGQSRGVAVGAWAS